MLSDRCVKIDLYYVETIDIVNIDLPCQLLMALPFVFAAFASVAVVAFLFRFVWPSSLRHSRSRAQK